jgi:hypothetical protein
MAHFIMWLTSISFHIPIVMKVKKLRTPHSPACVCSENLPWCFPCLHEKGNYGGRAVAKPLFAYGLFLRLTAIFPASKKANMHCVLITVDNCSTESFATSTLFLGFYRALLASLKTKTRDAGSRSDESHSVSRDLQFSVSHPESTSLSLPCMSLSCFNGWLIDMINVIGTLLISSSIISACYHEPSLTR